MGRYTFCDQGTYKFSHILNSINTIRQNILLNTSLRVVNECFRVCLCIDHGKVHLSKGRTLFVAYV